MDDNTSLLRLLISNPPMFILAMVAIIVGGGSYLAHRFVPAARERKTDEHRQVKPDLMEINRQLTESLATMTRLYQDAIREQARRDADVNQVK